MSISLEKIGLVALLISLLAMRIFGTRILDEQLHYHGYCR